MSLKLRLERLKTPRSKSLHGKWRARVQKGEEVHLRELAERMQENCTLKVSDIYAVLTELVPTMKEELQAGKTVYLDGFGFFHLTVESDVVDRPQDFSIARNIRRVLCRFVPSGRRNQDHTITRDLCAGVRLDWLPEYDRGE